MFRPTLWMSIFTAIALVILLALGTWQLQRLGWKRDLIHQIQTGMDARPIALPDSFSEDQKYQPVRLNGAFVADKYDTLFGRSYKGATGYLFLQPFRTVEGRVVLVNRGWVPERKRAPETWNQVSDDLNEVIGILRSGTWQGSKLFQPANDPKGDALIFVEPPLVARRLGIPELEPFYIDQIRPDNPSNFPIILATSIDIPNNHFQYAVTWYAFALILLVIYLLRSRRRP